LQQADGTYLRSFVLPETTPLPNVAISDTGKLIQYILDHPEKCLKKEIAFYSEAISEGEKIRDMASGKRPLKIDKIRTNQLVAEYGIDIRYNELSSEEFQGNLRKHMSDITALDFAEQLLIFRDFGMIYERPEFVQANQVSINFDDSI